MDIPFGQGALIDLGQSVENLGVAIAGFGEKAPQAKTYQNAAATTEYLKARQIYDDSMIQFQGQLESNPNHANFISDYGEFHDKLVNDLLGQLTLPQSKDMFYKYDTEQNATYFKQTQTAALKGIRVQAEATGQDFLDSAVKRGDVKATSEGYQVLVDGGIYAYSGDQREKLLSTARYNNAFNNLLPMDPIQRETLLLSGQVEKAFGVSTDQVTDMMTKFNTRQEQLDKAQKRQYDINNGKTELAMSDLLLKYMQDGIKGTPYKTWDELIASVGAQDWQGERAGDLQAKWAKVFKDADTPSTKDDPASVAIVTDIALNIDKNKVFTINGKKYTGVTNPTIKNSLLYETGLLNHGVTGRTFNEIVKMTDDLGRNPDWEPYIASVKNHFDTMLQAAAQNKLDEKTISGIAYRKEQGIIAILHALRDNPNNPAAREEAVRKLQQDNTSQILIDRTTQSLTPPGQAPAKFQSPWDNAVATVSNWFGANKKTGPVYSTEMKYEIARQQNPEAFRGDPSALPTWSAALPKIRTELRAALPKADQDAEIVTGEDNTTYFQKGNSLYSVRAAVIDGIIQLKAWKATRTSNGWSTWQ
jgi:hypothetical protein